MNKMSKGLRLALPTVVTASLMIGCGGDATTLNVNVDRNFCVRSWEDSSSYELYDSDTDESFFSPDNISISSNGDGSFEISDMSGEGSSREIDECSQSLPTTPDTRPDGTPPETTTDESTTSEVPSISEVTTTTVRASGSSTTAPRATTSMAPYGGTTTSYVPQGPPTGTWIRNDSRCSWRGASSCGVYSGGNGQWEEVGPSGGPGSTFTPIAGVSGEIAYNLYSGNSIMGCDYNGTGECGWYFTGTPGSLTMGPVG